MPRQAMNYTVPQPLEPLNIEEMKFWLHIMQEHAQFIKAGLPCEDTALIDEAQAFYKEFEVLRQRVEKVKTLKQCSELITEVYDTVKEFYCYKRELLQAKLACRLGGTNFPLFLDHLSREAEYFLRLLEKMRNGRVVLKEACQTQELVFWLRIMADHVKFMCHLLDPSERGLIRMANDFSCLFDNLVLQGRDFASMLYNHEGEVMAFRRFILDVRADVQRLRDFNKAAEDLIAECRLLGIMPESMADHLRREAEHFLLLLAMMERGLMKHSGSAFIEDIPCVDEEPEVEYQPIPQEKASKDECCEADERPPVSKKHKTPKFEVAPTAELMVEAEESDDSCLNQLIATAEEDCSPVVEEREIEITVQEQSQSKPSKAAKAVVQEELPVETSKVEEGKVMGKASSFKGLPNKHAIPADQADKKADAPKPKYKWGGSFPRSLGKVRD